MSKKLEDLVLEKLGTPDDLHSVVVKKLWTNYYRINVYRKINGLASITDSFFTRYADELPEFSPKITFKYYDAELGKLFKGLSNRLRS